MLATLSLPPLVQHIEAPLCCCLEVECAALKHNKQIMRQLESDLRTAAELGQHLLERQDRCAKEFEEERRRFLEEIESQSQFAKLVDELESNNRDLEYQNLCTMRENALLLRKLEDLNSSLNVSEGQNQELRTALIETEGEVGKLSHKTAKAKGLESHVLTVELERNELEREMETMTREKKQGNARYAQAQKEILDLQRQLDQIHATETTQLQEPSEPWSRLHRLTPIRRHGSDSLDLAVPPEAFSELLASNAILENNTTDLQRTLERSQDEVESLRRQLRLLDSASNNETLNSDNFGPRKTVSQELHQHHHYHYHVPTSKVTDKKSKTRSLIKKQSYNPVTESAEAMAEPEKNSRGHNTSRYKHHHNRLDTSTPLRQKTGHDRGLSDSTSSKGFHDSGYFSVGSEYSGDRSMFSIYQEPPSPLELLREVGEQSPPVSMAHGPLRRSNSHESIFLAQPELQDSPVAARNSTVVGRVREGSAAISSEVAEAPVQAGSIGRAGPLRHTASHESILSAPIKAPSQAELLLQRLRGSEQARRPFPSPLQKTTSEATVDVSPAMAASYSHSGGGRPSARTSSSFYALQNAAAAQKSASPGMSSPLAEPQSSSNFWKRSTEKAAPAVSRVSRPSPWSSIKKWHNSQKDATSSASTTSGIKVKGEAGEVPGTTQPKTTTQYPLDTSPYHARSETGAHDAAGSVNLSSLEKDLLLDALG